MHFRIDRLDGLKSLRRTDAGIVSEAFLTRTGVFVYREPDGRERREYRPPEEVFKADSLRSFAMVPVTNNHPPVLLTSKNSRRYAIGTTGENVRKDGRHVAAAITVFDEDTILAMEKGKNELSAGYQVDLDETPGVTPQGERYDAIQRNIRGNHVAIVDTGRAGPTVRVRMDGAGQVATQNLSCYNGEIMSVKDKLSELDAAEMLKRAADEQDRADSAEKSLKEAVARAEKAEGALESLKLDHAELQKKHDANIPDSSTEEIIAGLRAELAEATQARTDAEDPERLRSAVRERVAIETQALRVLGADYRVDTLDNRELMVAVIEKLYAQPVDKGLSDDYVRGRFDIVCTNHKGSSEALARVRRVATLNATTPRDDAESAREAMIKRNQNAYKKDSK